MESTKLSTILQPTKKNLKASNVISTENTSDAVQDDIKCILNFPTFSKSKIFYISNISKKSKQKETEKSFSNKNQSLYSSKSVINRS